MACADCERAAEVGEVYWFRWGAANIGIIGCRKDVTEVMDVLRKAQGGIAGAPDLLATLGAIVLPYREWLSDHADDAPTVERIEMTTSALREGLAAYDKAQGGG